MSKVVEEVAKKQSVAEIEEEIKRLELEAKKRDLELKELEVKEKKANLQDVQERLAEREVKRQNKAQTSLTNGATLKQTAQAQRAAETRCTHRKGGDGQRAISEGKGTDSQYAVLKHTFLNGDTWVRCLRCAKTWKPALKENFYFDEKGNHVPPIMLDHGRLLPPTEESKKRVVEGTLNGQRGEFTVQNLFPHARTGSFNQEKYLASVVEYQTALNFETRNQPSSSYMFRYSDNGELSRHILNNTTLR